jgi:hypothetical protein
MWALLKLVEVQDVGVPSIVEIPGPPCLQIRAQGRIHCPQCLFYLSVPIRRSCQPLTTLITVPLVQSTGSPRGCPTRLSSIQQLPCPQMLPQFLSLTKDVSPRHIRDTLPSNLL